MLALWHTVLVRTKVVIKRSTLLRVEVFVDVTRDGAFPSSSTGIDRRTFPAKFFSLQNFCNTQQELNSFVNQPNHQTSSESRLSI